MSGLSESKQTHIHLRNVDAATLQIIIVYAYTGNLAINDTTVEQLYETACFLQVRECSVLNVPSCNFVLKVHLKYGYFVFKLQTLIRMCEQMVNKLF